ncbi:hypothetical protein HELRODRAFT_184111 [Helobdella robusta]|uniref:Uncharacterized protein n=1 Tax=Helobdella robusta TaxID=6412 RepID=T1FKL6_HELRO|nr:hypothetical protein HELRODRAFT_184111 [Helobdella robusta]ESO07840.1 hypothetical protein HELRODRAFT_184111 [Helobdella robusta]
MLATKDASMLNELNNIGESALHEACLNKLPDNVNMLLQMGANSSLSASYRYPVHCAMQVDCISCVEVLHEYDNDVLKLAEKIYGNTAMHCLKSKQMFEFLRSKNCCLDEKNKVGDTPIMTKIKEGSGLTPWLMRPFIPSNHSNYSPFHLNCHSILIAV